MEEIVKCKAYIDIHIRKDPFDDSVITQGADTIICHSSEARQLADGIYRMLGDKVIVIHDNYGYDDLANDVANVLKQGRWAHLFFDEFINSLKSKFENNG